MSDLASWAAVFFVGVFCGAIGVGGVSWWIYQQSKKLWEERVAGLMKDAEQRVQIFNEMERRMESGFSALAGRALRESSTQQIGVLDQKVQPLLSAITLLDEKIRLLEQSRAGAYSGLSQMVQSLSESQVELRRETAVIRESLRSSTAKGRWGELQLRRIVELSGMREHCDFVEQQQIGDDTAEQKFRPDMIIRLSGDRTIVVDAKVPTQPSAIRRHVMELSSRSYWMQFARSPEFVVMFMPGDYFLAEALNEDADLLEFAIRLRVHIATPSTLIAMLKSVAFGMREEKIAQDAQDLLQLGKRLYARLCEFSETYSGVGQRIRQLNEIFNKSVNNFDSKLAPIAKDFAMQSLGSLEGAHALKTPPLVEQQERELESKL